MRTQRPKDAKQSEGWLRLLVNEHPALLNEALSTQFGKCKFETTAWLSPLASDEYAEYSDQSFLDLLGITLLTG